VDALACASEACGAVAAAQSYSETLNQQSSIANPLLKLPVTILESEIADSLLPSSVSRIPCPVSSLSFGLHKVEPKELAQIPARVVLESIDTHLRIERQEKLFA